MDRKIQYELNRIIDIYALRDESCLEKPFLSFSEQPPIIKELIQILEERGREEIQ